MIILMLVIGSGIVWGRTGAGTALLVIAGLFIADGMLNG